jgi:hypothetical protein
MDMLLLAAAFLLIPFFLTALWPSRTLLAVVGTGVPVAIVLLLVALTGQSDAVTGVGAGYFRLILPAPEFSRGGHAVVLLGGALLSVPIWLLTAGGILYSLSFLGAGWR